MPRGRVARSLLVWVPASALAALWLGTSLFQATTHHSRTALLCVAVLYLLLALTLHTAGLFLVRVWTPLALLGALAVGALTLWQLAEQLWVMALPSWWLELAGGIVGLAELLLLLRTRDVVLVRPGGRAALAFAAFAALLLGAYFGSDDLRWQLLRHHETLGTPLYFLLAEPVGQVSRELWEAHAGNGAPSPAPRPARREHAAKLPDIVVILVDTLRADALAAYGGSPDLMPATNRFAERALVFTNVDSNSSWTRASVGSLFTGLLPEQHGAVGRGDRLPERLLTLAESLSALGYRTAAFVANYANVGRATGFAQGFDHFEEIESRTGPYARAQEVNRSVKTWLFDAGEPAQPRFLYVHYLDPHAPYLTGPVRATGSVLPRVGYEAELRYLDGFLRDLLDTLDHHLAPGRFTLLTSDHGEEFGEHGEFGHGRSLYPEVLRIPAVLATPAGDSGRDAAPLELRDFFGLLRDAAQTGAAFDVRAWAQRASRGIRYASVDTQTDGTVLKPFLRRVFMRSVEAEGFQAIWSAYGSTWELYDLECDPKRERNLVGEDPQRLEALRSALESAAPDWIRRDRVKETPENLELLRELGYVE